MSDLSKDFGYQIEMTIDKDFDALADDADLELLVLVYDDIPWLCGSYNLQALDVS